MAGARPEDDTHISHFPVYFVGSINFFSLLLLVLLCLVYFLWHRFLRKVQYLTIDHSHRENASDSIIDRSLSSSDEFETRAEEGKEISFRHWKSQQSENTITSDDVSVTEAEI